MNEVPTTHLLSTSLLRTVRSLLPWIVMAAALAAVLDHQAKGVWWDRAYWFSMIIPLTVIPLAVWVLSVPRSIEWSRDGCVIRTRLGGPLSFSWDQLVGFGNGRGCFLLQFTGAPQFAIYPGAFARTQWKEFKQYLRTSYPKKGLFAVSSG